MTIFVIKGSAPLTNAQLEKRAQKYINRSWTAQAREKSIRMADGAFDTFMTAFSADHDVNKANNLFNWQLQEYLKATARLAQYRLAVGRPEVYEDQLTGQFNPETGEELTESVLVQTSIEPLDAQVEQSVYDEEGNLLGTETVDNPLIVKDDAERAVAQSVVDSMPDEDLTPFNEAVE